MENKVYLISDNATPKREINVDEEKLLKMAKKFFNWRKVSLQRIKRLGSVNYDKLIEFVYQKENI